ncbi:MAG: hypothetical protein JJT85_05855 [Chromatiales bacterium]|nr:hypothetical protein [Chromatiales bacterium]
MVQPLTRSAVAAPGSAPGPLRAPLFAELIRRIPLDRRQVVLDLGPVRPETVSLFSAYRCRMEIADLAPQLARLNAPIGEDEPGLEARIAEALPAERGEPVDIVLGWDLFNYLERPVLTALMDVIASRCRPGSLVHFLLAYSSPRMAAVPGRFAPGAEGQLLHEPQTREEKAAPRYSPEDLAHCLQDFQVVRAMLLKNGMQEFLYRA